MALRKTRGWREASMKLVTWYDEPDTSLMPASYQPLASLKPAPPWPGHQPHAGRGWRTGLAHTSLTSLMLASYQPLSALCSQHTAAHACDGVACHFANCCG